MKLMLGVLSLGILLTISILPLNAQWMPTNGPNSGGVFCLTVSGSNLLAGATGIYITSDSGANWIQTSSGIPPYTGITSIVNSESNLFAGALNGGVFLSTNSGSSWAQVGLSDTLVYCLAASGANLFAGTNRGVFL